MTISDTATAKTRLLVSWSLAALLLATGVGFSSQGARAQFIEECGPATKVARASAFFRVSTALDDDSPCNLRNLLTNARPGDTITFDPESFPRNDPATIRLRRALPQIVRGGVTINGTGAGVVIDGAAVPIPVPGLVLASDNNTVVGLMIRGMSIGIVVSVNQNIIGRAGVPGAGGLPTRPSNSISGNSVHGISITGDDNVVRGNYLGTDASGLRADRNGINGVHILGGKRNIVGGMEPGLGNLISGNGQAGIKISGEQAFENHLLGNFIGTDLSGTVAIPNRAHGVEITGLAGTTRVGGEEDGAGNLISGNGASGIYLERASNTNIKGNIIGADVDRTMPLPNGSNGVEIVNSGFGSVGDHVKPSTGSCGGSCNLVSGNIGNGIVVRGEESMKIRISGNWVGLDKTGVEGLGNGAAGIFITEGAHDIQIGNALDTANVIGGNTGPGIWLLGEGVAEIPILGNVIGLGADTATPVGNQYGIVLEQGPHDNVIGPKDQDKNKVNIISGNRGHGVRILGSETAENTVARNFVGTTPQGHDYVGNGGAGVLIKDGAHDNTIGIAGDERMPDDEDNPDGNQHIGNIIASNQVAGVAIESAVFNYVLGNRIGQSSYGAVLGNQSDGVLISDSSAANEVLGNLISYNRGNGVRLRSGANGNIVGMRGESRDLFLANLGNVIIRNEGSGVLVHGGGTSGNLIAGNMIGTNQDRGQNLGNGRLGVYLDGGGDGGANGNTIEANHIVKTTDAAIGISNSNGNLVIENSIGQSWAPEFKKIIFGNSGQGIYLLHGASGNRLEDNVIARSRGHGIVVAQDQGEQTGNNTITRNSIFRNGGRGIYLNGGNKNLEAPLLTGLLQPDGDKWTVKGEACANCTVEVFSDNLFQGRMFEGSDVSNNLGRFAIEGVSRTNERFLLTATDEAGNTSEFGTSDDLQIFAVEVTQAVQDLDNSIALVAGQTTYVRVHVNSDIGPIQATAQLSVFQEGRPVREMRPTGAGCPAEITVQRAPKRSELDHAFCFRLPFNAINAGEIRLTAEVEMLSEEIRDLNPADNVFQVGPLRFEERSPVDLIIFRVGYPERIVRHRKFDFPSEAEVAAGTSSFTNNDFITTGDVDGDGEDEVLIGGDVNHRIDVWGLDESGKSIEFEGSFDGGFRIGDRLAAGDVDGDGRDEVVVAHRNTSVDVWQLVGSEWRSMGSFQSRFRQDYPLAVGNLLPEADPPIDEIMVGETSGFLEMIDLAIYQWDGETWDDVKRLRTPFKPGDRFTLGNFVPGAAGMIDLEEIVAGRDVGPIGQRHLVEILEFDGDTWTTAGMDFRVRTNLDALAAGDMDDDGDRLSELVVGERICGCVDVWKWDTEEEEWVWTTRTGSIGAGPKPFTFPGSLAIGDRNGDGLAEVFAGQFNDTISVFSKKQPGSWGFTQPSYNAVQKIKSYLRRTYSYEPSKFNIQTRDLDYPRHLPHVNRDELISLMVSFRQPQSGIPLSVPIFAFVDEDVGGGRALIGPRVGTGGEPDIRVASHEIGHTLGMPHITGCEDPSDPVRNVYPEGRIGGPAGAASPVYLTPAIFGFDTGDGQLNLPLKIYPGDTWKDFMTYCEIKEGGNFWISDWTRDLLARSVEVNPAVGEDEAADLPLADAQAADGRDGFIFLSGMIDASGSVGEIINLFEVAQANPTDLPSASPVVLRLEAEAGRVLAEYLLDVETSRHQSGDESALYFSEVTPFPESARKISFIYEGNLVFSREVSANPPQVTLIHPNGGEPIGETITVTWQGSDEDGDDLTYSVLYSKDGGSSWRQLAVHWPDSSYTMNTARLPGSSQGRFRVVAHDGVRTGQDTSDGNLGVPFRPPQVEIVFPADETRFGPGQTYIFSGQANDPDGRVISEGSFQWSSNIDGPMGPGQEILRDRLSKGEHVITLSVTDSGGLTGESSIRITVLDESSIRTVEPGELPDTDSGVDPRYLQPGKVLGRAITGPVTAIQGSILTVLTDQGEVGVQVKADTRISAPPDAGLDSITTEPPTRLAVLTDRVQSSGNTALSNEPITALKITVIPLKTTREHRRVVVAGDGQVDRLRFVNAAGATADLAVDASQSLNSGDVITVLTQRTGDQRVRIKGIVPGGTVARRLEKLADQTARRPEDSIQSALLLEVLNKHLDAEENRLQQTLSRAPEELKSLVGETIQRVVKFMPGRDGDKGKRSVGQVRSECVQKVFGRRPDSGITIHPDDQRLIDSVCGSLEAPAKIKITSPGRGANITEGTTIIVNANAGDVDSFVTLGFTINGEAQELVTGVDGFSGLAFYVPLGVPSLTIEVKATDVPGNFTFDSLSLPVSRDPPPTIGVLELFQGWNLLTGSSSSKAVQSNLVEGEKYSIVVQVEDNVEVVSVEVSFGGKSYPTSAMTNGKWVAEITAPEGQPISEKVSTLAPPHVVVGTATIDGENAPEGAIVTAWLGDVSASTLTISFTATDNLLRTATTSQDVQVMRKEVKVGEAIVSGGGYSLLVHQRVGQSFAGKTITFKIDGVAANETAIWQQGGGDELNLSAGK